MAAGDHPDRDREGGGDHHVDHPARGLLGNQAIAWGERARLERRRRHRRQFNLGLERIGRQADGPRIAAQVAAHEHRGAQPAPVFGLQRLDHARGHAHGRGDFGNSQSCGLAGLAEAEPGPLFGPACVRCG